MAEKIPETDTSTSQFVDHSEYQLMISLGLDGMLNAHDQGRLDGHLEQCGDCREQWQLWQIVDKKLRAAHVPELALDFSHRVAEQLSRRERMRNVQIALLLTVLTVFVWALGLIGFFGLVSTLIYTNLDRFAATGQLLADGWEVAGVVGESLWGIIIELTATPAALGVASAYFLIAGLALVVWCLVIQRSAQPVRSRLFGDWRQSTL